jgi:hypothetical protein
VREEHRWASRLCGRISSGGVRPAGDKQRWRSGSRPCGRSYGGLRRTGGCAAAALGLAPMWEDRRRPSARQWVSSDDGSASVVQLHLREVRDYQAKAGCIPLTVHLHHAPRRLSPPLYSRTCMLLHAPAAPSGRATSPPTRPSDGGRPR